MVQHWIMADLEHLKQSVEKAKENVEMQNKTVERHQKQLVKLQEKAQALGCDLSKDSSYYHQDTDREKIRLMNDIVHKEEDIELSLKKLEVLNDVLVFKQTKLDVEIQKQEYIEGICPEVIRTFLENWKTRCYEYYLQHYEEYLVYKDQLYKEELEVRKEVLLNHPALESIREREYVKKHIAENDFDSYFLYNVANYGEPSKVMETALKEKSLDWRSIGKRISNYAGEVVLLMENYHDGNERNNWLLRYLERKKKEKMIDLIERITHITGKIEDAASLHIGAKGDINGWIIGDKGTASIETIGAGGYNIQCYHFRTLIHKVEPVVKKKSR